MSERDYTTPIMRPMWGKKKAISLFQKLDKSIHIYILGLNYTFNMLIFKDSLKKGKRKNLRKDSRF